MRKSANIHYPVNSLHFRGDLEGQNPNPALDYIIVELNTGNTSGAVISLFDNQGKPVRSVNIPARQQNYVLGLKDVKPGMYVIKVDCNGKNIGNKKFSIIK